MQTHPTEPSDIQELHNFFERVTTQTQAMVERWDNFIRHYQIQEAYTQEDAHKYTQHLKATISEYLQAAQFYKEVLDFLETHERLKKSHDYQSESIKNHLINTAHKYLAKLIPPSGISDTASVPELIEQLNELLPNLEQSYITCRDAMTADYQTLVRLARRLDLPADFNEKPYFKLLSQSSQNTIVTLINTLLNFVPQDYARLRSTIQSLESCEIRDSSYDSQYPKQTPKINANKLATNIQTCRKVLDSLNAQLTPLSSPYSSKKTLLSFLKLIKENSQDIPSCYESTTSQDKSSPSSPFPKQVFEKVASKFTSKTSLFKKEPVATAETADTDSQAHQSLETASSREAVAPVLDPNKVATTAKSPSKPNLFNTVALKTHISEGKQLPQEVLQQFNKVVCELTENKDASTAKKP